jgi:hypothetical protein
MDVEVRHTGQDGDSFVLWEGRSHVKRLLLIFALACSSPAFLAADDNPAWSFYSVGVQAYFDHQPQEAIRELTTAATGLDDPRVFYFRGLAYQQLGQSVDAQADFSRGAELERGRINIRQLMLSETERMSQVNTALQRVQGPAREELEKARLSAVGQIRTAQKIKQRKLALLKSKEERFAGGLVAPPPKGKPGYRDLVGQKVQWQSGDWQVLDVDADAQGIRAITLIDAAVSLDPARYDRTSYQTKDGWVSGDAALQYRIAKDARLVPASQLGRMETGLLGALAYNPLSQAVTTEAEAKQGWKEFRAKEQARLRQLAEEAAQRRAEQEARLAAQRAAEEARLAAAAPFAAPEPLLAPTWGGEAAPESYAVNEPPPSFTPAGVDWAIDQAEGWSFESPAPAAVTDQDRLDRAVQNIVAACALHMVKLGTQSEGARQWVHDTNDPLETLGRGLLMAGIGVLASSGRDQQIDAALAEAFPDLPGVGRIAIKNFITLAADGRLSKAAWAGHSLKDIVMAELGRADPELAGNVQAVEFVVKVVSQFPSAPGGE